MSYTLSVKMNLQKDRLANIPGLGAFEDGEHQLKQAQVDKFEALYNQKITEAKFPEGVEVKQSGTKSQTQSSTQSTSTPKSDDDNEKKKGDA